MWAPNRPVSTTGSNACARDTTWSNRRLPASGDAALERLGRAPLRIGGKRELGDEQKCAADVGDAAIHPPLGIGEYAVADQTLDQPIAFALGVSALDADQHHQAAADGADGVRTDLDLRARDALEQPDHRRRVRPGRSIAERPP